MRKISLFAFAVLLPLTVWAGQECTKDAEGNTSCKQTSSEAATQPGAVRDESEPSNTGTPDEKHTKSTHDNADEQGFGSDTSQSMEPGMTY